MIVIHVNTKYYLVTLYEIEGGLGVSALNQQIPPEFID